MATNLSSLVSPMRSQDPGDVYSLHHLVPGDRSMQNESQKSDMNVIALERNSLNFLE